jgi:hypothetical protein
MVRLVFARFWLRLDLWDFREPREFALCRAGLFMVLDRVVGYFVTFVTGCFRGGFFYWGF